MFVNNDRGIVRRVEPAVKLDSQLGSKKKQTQHMIRPIAAGVPRSLGNGKTLCSVKIRRRDSHEKNPLQPVAGRLSSISVMGRLHSMAMANPAPDSNRSTRTTAPSLSS